MNEHIDILLTASKLDTRNNPWAHLATQTLSIGYHASQLWRCNYQLAMIQAIGSGYVSAEQIKQMEQERAKHTSLLLIVGLGLIATGVCALYKRY